MNVIKTALDGVVIIEPRIFEDSRGYFFESFSERDFNAQVREIRCKRPILTYCLKA